MNGKRLAPFAPALFVLLWSSGFVFARLVTPFSEPFSFITVRFVLSAILLCLIALAGRARWPRHVRGWTDALVAGALMQGCYIGGVFWAVKHGLPAGIAALITGLQPLLTGLLAKPLLGERVTSGRWVGIATGFAGAVLVIAPKLSGTAALSPVTVASCFGATLGITLGTIWQKRVGGLMDLRAGASIQFIGGLLVVVPLMLVTGQPHVGTETDVWIGMIWSVLVLSVGATLLLLSLIKGGEVASVASLFYLVPPVTAIVAFVMFGETLTPIQFVGMAVAALGVALANRKPAARAASA